MRFVVVKGGEGASVKVMLLLTYVSRLSPNLDCLSFLMAEYPGNWEVLFEIASLVSCTVIISMFSWVMSCCSSAVLF